MQPQMGQVPPERRRTECLPLLQEAPQKMTSGLEPGSWPSPGARQQVPRP